MDYMMLKPYTNECMGVTTTKNDLRFVIGKKYEQKTLF